MYESTLLSAAVLALASLEVRAVQVNANLTPDQRAQWKSYWADKQDEYSFGSEVGEYDKICTTRAEKAFWKATYV